MGGTAHPDYTDNHGPRNQTLPAGPGHPHPARLQELHPPGLDGRGLGRGGERPHQRPGRRRHRAHGPGPDAVGGRDRLAGHDHPGDGPRRPLAAGAVADLPGQLRHLHALPHGPRGPGRGRVPPHRHRAPLPAAPGGVAGRPPPGGGPGRLRERRRLPPGAGHRRPHRRPGATFRRHEQPVPLGPAVHRAPGARRASRSTSPASWCPGPTWT